MQTPTVAILPLQTGERWWGGSVEDGIRMPFGDGQFSRDLAVASQTPEGSATEPSSSQSAPLLISTHGRYVFAGAPFRFGFNDGELALKGRGIVHGQAGINLRDAFLEVSRNISAPAGRTPALELLSAPQYNTWIEMPYQPTQDKVLAYARGLLDAGMKPGVLMIDDSWSPDYGMWHFDPARFPDPRAMTDQLHEWGFHVMLWLVPFISPDSPAFRELEQAGLLVRDATGATAVRRWWNGLSALLDVSNPASVSWLTEQLDALIDRDGVDGFKFDGGDIRDFHPGDLTHQPLHPTQMCEAWAAVGLRYPFNEYRACWRMGGQPLAQRLQDKPPSWGDDGIRALIPEMLAQAMIGHPYTCPDMIGGGEVGAMSAQGTVDQEFFVRYAQVAALSPMAQFSVAPARVLDAEHLAAVEEALEIREEHLPLILALAQDAARTGEPIIRPMAYHAPELPDVTDQFFLGPDLIVAPVLERGARSRSVQLPQGTWVAPDGTSRQGPAVVELECDLRSIPRFERSRI